MHRELFNSNMFVWFNGWDEWILIGFCLCNKTILGITYDTLPITPMLPADEKLFHMSCRAVCGWLSLFFFYPDIITSACWGFRLNHSYLITAAIKTDAELCHQETVNRNTQLTRRITDWRGCAYELLLILANFIFFHVTVTLLHACD